MCFYFDSLDRYSLIHKDNAAVVLISDWISLFDLVRNMLSLIFIMLSKLENFMALTPQFCTIKAELTFWRVSNYFYCAKKYMGPFVLKFTCTKEYTVRNQSMAGIHSFPLCLLWSPTDMRFIHIVRQLIWVVLCRYTVGSYHLKVVQIFLQNWNI